MARPPTWNRKFVEYRFYIRPETLTALKAEAAGDDNETVCALGRVALDNWLARNLSPQAKHRIWFERQRSGQ